MKRIVLVMNGPELVNKLHRNVEFIEDFLNNPYLNEIIVKFNMDEYKTTKSAWDSMRISVYNYFGSRVTAKVRNGKFFLKKKRIL